MSAPFDFYTERRLVTLTGRSARNLAQLLEQLHEVSGSCIFFHTHHQYLAHQFGTGLFHDDFANWVSRSLLEEQLAERLSAIDPIQFPSIRQMRGAIAGAVEEHLANTGRNRDCIPGDEFHFCESQSFVLRSGLSAHSVEEFASCLLEVSDLSLYFHFFEARLRLERPANDFSQWLRHIGQDEFAARIDGIHPYGIPLSELRRRILTAVTPRAEVAA